MPFNWSTVLFRNWAFWAFGLLALILIGAGVYWFVAKGTKENYVIGVILSKAEMPQEELDFHKFLIARKLESINQEGGINGRKVEALYLDDNLDDNKLYEQVRQTSRNEYLIAYIGCRGLSRAKKIAPLLTKNKIPFIGRFVFTDHLKQHPNMYTASVGIKEGKLVFLELLKARATKIGFIGESESMTSKAMQDLVEDLVSQTPGLAITVNRLFPKPINFKNVHAGGFADSLKNLTDFVVVASGPKSSNSVLTFLSKHGINVPVFIAFPDMAELDLTSPAYRATELFGINTFGITGAQNTRLQEQLTGYHKKFKQGAKTTYLLSQVGRLVDEIGLLHEASQVKQLPANTGIRDRINTGLKQYINGTRIYRGYLADWYFTPENAYGGESLLAWKLKNSALPMLASTQFFRAGSSLYPVPVFYTSLNMVQIDQVNEEGGTFFASFYLELNSFKDFNLDQVDFANAVRNELDHKPLLEARLIRSGKDSLGYKYYHRLYKISGQFYFEPDLRNYPLDKQKFNITLQASNAWQPFLIQPSVKEKQDSDFESKGWVYKEQYVGFNQDIIASPGTLGQANEIIPHYKFTYAYIMKRSHIDFFLKTLVPLLAILVTAYFSVYIPPREFEALAGIQVTALLSSIALYFATYKPQMPYATISDRVFIFTYIMVTTLIGTSIIIYVLGHERKTIQQTAQIYQRIIFPVIVIGFMVFLRWF